MKEKNACKWPQFIFPFMILLVLVAGSATIITVVNAATISVVPGELITLPKFTDTQYLLEGKTYELRYMGLSSGNNPFYIIDCSDGWGTTTLPSTPPPSVFMRICDLSMTSGQSYSAGREIEITSGDASNMVFRFTLTPTPTPSPTPTPTPSNLLSCSAYSDGIVVSVSHGNGKTDIQECQAAGHEGCYFHCCSSSTCSNVDPNSCGTNACNGDFGAYACCKHGSGAPSPTPTPTPTPTPYCGDYICTAAINETTSTCCRDCGCPPTTQNSCCDRMYYGCNVVSCLYQDSPNNARCRPYEYCRSDCACISNACSSYITGIGCDGNPTCKWCSYESKCKTSAETCATPTSTPTPTPTPAGLYCGDLKCSQEIGESQSTCCTDCGCPSTVQTSCCERSYVCSNGTACIPSNIVDNSRCASWEYCRSDCVCVSNACSSYITGIGCNTNPGCGWCGSEVKCKSKSEACAAPTPSPTPVPTLTPGVGSCGVFCGNAGDCGPCQRCAASTVPANYRCEPDTSCPACKAGGGCGETHAGNWPESCTSICGKFGMVCERTASCGSSCVNNSGNCDDIVASCGNNGATGMELGCVCKKKEEPAATVTPQPTGGGEEAAAARAAISSASASVSDAEGRVVQAAKEGREVETAIRKIGEARGLIAQASSSAAKEDYTEAKGFAQSASSKATEAVGLIPAEKAGSSAIIALMVVTIAAVTVIGLVVYFVFLKPKKPQPIQTQPYYYTGSRRY